MNGGEAKEQRDQDGKVAVRLDIQLLTLPLYRSKERLDIASCDRQQDAFHKHRYSKLLCHSTVPAKDGPLDGLGLPYWRFAYSSTATREIRF